MAGGLATRLRPITEKIPKALIEVAGKPFIEWQLNYLRKQGIHKIVICIGYLGEMIQDLVGSGKQLDLQICYSSDGSTLLGTGGAIKKALPLLGENFFILYGDSYLPTNFCKVKIAYENSKKKALMTVFKNKNCWDKSNVRFENGKILNYDKFSQNIEMHYIDYGLSIASAEVFAKYESEKPFDLADVYQTLVMQDQLAGFEIYERFYEIGSYSGLKETESFLKNITQN